MMVVSSDFYAVCRNLDEVFAFFEQRQNFPDLDRNSASYPPARCYVCAADVAFELDENAVSPQFNWRESVVCPQCALINRWRSCVHVFELLCGPQQRKNIYMTEQITLLFSQFMNRYPNVTGSEFDQNHDSGTILETPAGRVMVQDVTKLSFADRQFNSVLSMDVLEHVPHYGAALNEFARVIADDGLLLLSVPFSFSHDSITRAEIGPDGEVIHHYPPEYHEDPLSAQGVLCFHSFGMDMLDALKSAGFRDSYVLAFSSISWGYPDRNIMFVGVK